MADSAPVAAEESPMRGWFIAPGITGDRTLEEQLMGVELLAPHARGASVLDLGCAEGLIARYCVQAWGARLVHGLTREPDQVAKAREFCAGLPVHVWQCNLGDWQPWLRHNWKILQADYDIVLALSIIHKVRLPERFIEELQARARSWLAVRLPKRVHHDKRSNLVPIDPVGQLVGRFELVAEPPTCRDEWLGIFRRL